MSLITASDSDNQLVKISRSYRSKQELALRDMIERWGRAKWPEARCVHELVMGRGTVRADMAFVSPAHIAVIEIKSEYDDTNRLIVQAGTFRLAVPELWVISPNKHIEDAELVRYLMPSIGLGTPSRESLLGTFDAETEVVERSPASAFQQVPKALLSLLWVAELAAEARRHRLLQDTRKKSPNHNALVSMLLTLTPEEQLASVCRQLRSRDAFWRADPVVLQ